MPEYTCARCGSSEVTVSEETQEVDGDSDDDRVIGWCHECDDYRPVEE